MAHSPERLVGRMLSVLEEDVLPLTQAGIDAGNKVFGAAILLKSTLDLVIVGTNEEAKNPLFHGEVSCLNRYWEMAPESRPPPSDCLFLSSHEPCSLCLSAITWSGFDNFYYLFGYEDTRDAFDIPHDLNILAEVFRCSDGDYATPNAYWSSFHLVELMKQATEEDQQFWSQQVARLQEAYCGLSDSYQASKGAQDIPLD
jgi:tRNA(Arg) A34 adenosine deaminase TadA